MRMCVSESKQNFKKKNMLCELCAREFLNSKTCLFFLLFNYKMCAYAKRTERRNFQHLHTQI